MEAKKLLTINIPKIWDKIRSTDPSVEGDMYNYCKEMVIKEITPATNLLNKLVYILEKKDTGVPRYRIVNYGDYVDVGSTILPSEGIRFQADSLFPLNLYKFHVIISDVLNIPEGASELDAVKIGRENRYGNFFNYLDTGDILDGWKWIEINSFNSLGYLAYSEFIRKGDNEIIIKNKINHYVPDIIIKDLGEVYLLKAIGIKPYSKYVSKYDLIGNKLPSLSAPKEIADFFLEVLKTEGIDIVNF